MGMTKQDLMKEIFDAYNNNALSFEAYDYLCNVLDLVDQPAEIPDDLTFALGVVGGTYASPNGFSAVRTDSVKMYEVYNPDGWWLFDTNDIREVMEYLDL